MAWYTYGAQPTGISLSTIYSTFTTRYNQFKTLTFTQDGTTEARNRLATQGINYTSNIWRVKRPNTPYVTNNNNDTVSEGIAYGMMMTAYTSKADSAIYDANAKEYFDGFWAYYKAYRNAHGLMNWQVNQSGGIQGTGGATDADNDVAFALIMMHRIHGSVDQRHNYEADAKNLINAILNWEITPTTHQYPNVMLPGDEWPASLRSSASDYFRPAFYREFSRFMNDSTSARWLEIINVNYERLFRYFHNNYSTGFVPNWTNYVNNSIPPSSEVPDTNPNIYGYNAIRYGWGVTLDYLWNGPTINELGYVMPYKLAQFNKTNSGGVVDNCKAVWTLNGSSNDGYNSIGFTIGYGVAGLVSADHASWSGAVATWMGVSGSVQSNFSIDYYVASTAVIGLLVMSGEFQPIITAPTGGGTPTTPGTGYTTDLYVNPNTQLALHLPNVTPGLKRQRLAWVTSIPQATWIGIEWDPNCDNLRNYMTAANAAGKIGMAIAYSIPGRDLGDYSAGGANSVAEYNTWWGKFMTAIGTKACIVSYEPDALPQSTSMTAALKAERYSLMRQSIIDFRTNCPNAFIYVDCSHSQWKSSAEIITLLQLIDGHNAHGFSSNVSNFRPDAELQPWAAAILAGLPASYNHFEYIYDTSRNGNTVASDPGLWANPAHRQFGTRPVWLSANTGVARCAGKLWLKSPGESDGSNGANVPPAGALFLTYLYNDNVGDNVSSGNNNTDQVFVTSGMCQREPAITLSNAGSGGGTVDSTPPTVSFTTPLNGTTISGLTPIRVTATDNIGVVGVQLKLDGNIFGTEDVTSPFAWNWNTPLSANGTYALSATARDAAGNTSTATVNVTVNNTAPTSGAATRFIGFLD